MSNKESIDMNLIKKIFKDEEQKKELLTNDNPAKIQYNAETQPLTPNINDEIKFQDMQFVDTMHTRKQDEKTKNKHDDNERIENSCNPNGYKLVTPVNTFSPNESIRVTHDDGAIKKVGGFIDKIFDKKTKIEPISIDSCSPSAFKSEHVREVLGIEKQQNIIDIQKIEIAEQEKKWKTVTVSDKTKVGKRIDEVFGIRPKIDPISIDGCSPSEIRPSLSEQEIKTTLTGGRHETLDAIFDDCVDNYDNANLKKMIIINDNILIHEQSMGKIEILGVKVTIIIAFDNKIDNFREFEIVDHNKIYVPFANKNKIKCAIAVARELIRFFKL